MSPLSHNRLLLRDSQREFAPDFARLLVTRSRTATLLHGYCASCSTPNTIWTSSLLSLHLSQITLWRRRFWQSISENTQSRLNSHASS